MREGTAISVIIPALDEEAAVAGVIAAVPSWADRIVVVDNGSTDRTVDVAQAAGAEVIRETRRGYGRACLAGIDHVDGETDVIVFLDADGSDHPEQMERLLAPIVDGRADLVVGSRVRGRLARGAMTAPQRLGNIVAPALIRLIWGERFTDLGPFRAVRAAALRALRMDDETYGWTVQMQIRAARFGLRCEEVPVDYERRAAGRSKISGTVRGVVKAGTCILACVAGEALRPRHRQPQRREALAVMTRYPEAGRVKTRLIPALGAEGAAAVHARMLQHTAGIVRAVAHGSDVDTHVRHDGGDRASFESLLGPGLTYVAQCAGDLGARLDEAFRAMLRDATAAITIGTDCPELAPEHVRDAFTMLRTHDVVIGPATDGGYYLLGLRRPVPSLFADMPWGEDGVRDLTLSRAERLGLSVHLLPVLDDVDEPADLPRWERVQGDDIADDELLRSFRAASIPIERWTHRTHLRVAFLLLRGRPFEDGIAEVRDGIRALNAALGIVNGPETGYHETITVAWGRLVQDGAGAGESSVAFLADHPELLNTRVLLRHYTRDRIMSDEARGAFVAPDLEPLPGA